MAKDITPVANPQMELRRYITQFHKDTLDQIDINLATQQVWPTEVYPGYKKVNELRKKRKQWHSTGKGRRSIKGKIVAADDIDNITLEYSFLNYMRFAEIGVGQGVSASDVDRSKNVKYKNRYISSWDRSEGRSHRPSIRSEVNHLARRIEMFVCDFYGKQISAQIVNGLTVDVDVSKAMSMLNVL